MMVKVKITGTFCHHILGCCCILRKYLSEISFVAYEYRPDLLGMMNTKQGVLILVHKADVWGYIGPSTFKRLPVFTAWQVSL